jgi:hypothetical protein
MKYVSINGLTIRRNAIMRTDEPPIRIAKTPSDAKPIYASEIEIVGPARLVYDSRNKIMRCGARMVLICKDVKVIK